MLLQGNTKIVRRSQRLASGAEYQCSHCGAPACALEMDFWGRDEEGEPDIYHDYQLLCTVCDADHPEFRADAFLSQIIKAEAQAHRIAADHLPNELREARQTGDWFAFNDYYARQVYGLLAVIGYIDSDELRLLAEVAATRGWLISTDVAPEPADDDLNILAESEADFDGDPELSALIENLAHLTRPTFPQFQCAK